MTLPLRIQEAMQMQVEAERKKRASILESEGKFRSNEATRGFFLLHVLTCGGKTCYICECSFKIINVFWICKKISVLSGEFCHRFTTITLPGMMIFLLPSIHQ